MPENLCDPDGAHGGIAVAWADESSRAGDEATVTVADTSGRPIQGAEARLARGGRPIRVVGAWLGHHPWWAAALAVLAVLSTVGIVGGLRGGPGPRPPAPSSGPGAARHSGSVAAASSAAAAAPTAAVGSATAAAGGQPNAGSSGPSNAGPALPSRVIKTGSLNLQVPLGHLLTTISAMSSESTGLGGFVASSTTNTSTTGSPASGDITLRVPVQSFNALLADVEHLGRATSVATSGQDVTGQYVDLQARIQSLQDARSQFQQILTKAQSIGDILAVEQQISTQQTQIEQLQGQLKVLDDQSSYSTLTAHIVEAVPAGGSPRPASGLSQAWTHARRSFTHGLESIVAFSGGLVLFLLVVGLLALVARFVWTYLRRRPA